MAILDTSLGDKRPTYFLKDAFIDKRIVIATCTHGRRAQLLATLELVSKLKIEAYYDITVLIVENELEPKLTDDLAVLDFPFSIKHVCEPRIGLANARNRSLDEADRLGADWLCMLDDDDEVQHDWLLRFEQAASEFSEGRVFLGLIDVKLPEEYSCFLSRYRPRNVKLGAYPPIFGTGNCMIGRMVFARDALGHRFHPRFNTSGAEDTDFFMRIEKGGCQLYHVPEAIVYEFCKGERGTYQYHFRRRRWEQANNLLLDQLHFGTATSWHRLLANLYRNTLLCIWGILTAVVALVSSPKKAPIRLGNAGLRIARILGTLDYCLGKKQIPYDVSRNAKQGRQK